MAIGEGFLVNEDERNKEQEEVVITDLEDEEKATEILKTKVERVRENVLSSEANTQCTFCICSSMSWSTIRHVL